MQITRHFVDIGVRRVHYRRCGTGPALLMVHQSPRSSAEYEPLMREWGAHFTCIAPDTPGFGHSHPLTGEPEIDQFADALVDLLGALGLGKVATYGFHSGGIILVNALKRHPERFTALAVGGYAIWTPEEMAIFGERYLPPFVPSAYGEHLTWLWNRVLEQSWFFPWFDVRDEARLSVAHDDIARVHAVVMDMLDAGDAYRAGYGAVLRAPRDIPPPDAATPPVLITAYDGDPLQAHIDRLGVMPKRWQARKVATPADHAEASLAFLREHPGDEPVATSSPTDQGFVTVSTPDFAGQLRWHGDVLDLPGFGLSDDWAGEAPLAWRPWQAVVDAAGTMLGRDFVVRPPLKGDPARLYPDLTPDRFGTYLTKAWQIVRARALFSPWYEAGAASALPVDAAALDPQALACAHLDVLRARSAKAYHIAWQTREKA